MRRIPGAERVLGVAMCRALHEEWDLEQAVEHVLALGVRPPAIEAALAEVRRSRRSPTAAAGRVEQALVEALRRSSERDLRDAC